MRFDLVTPTKMVWTTEAEEVSAPGSEGDFGVLNGHQPFITTLKPGPLTIKANGEETVYCVSYGFVDVNPESVTVLAEEVVKASDIDVSQVQEDIRAAQGELAASDSEVITNRAEKRIAALQAMLDVAA